MSKLTMTFEAMHLQAKGNTDQVLVQADAAPGVLGLLWLDHVPKGGALCRAVVWVWNDYYPSFVREAVDKAARFAAVLKPVGLRLYLDDVEVNAVWDEEDMKLVPVQVSETSPEDDIEEARRRA